MPAPAVYVAVATVAGIVAFTQFVYVPHIHPKIVQAYEGFKENRRRRGMSQPHSAQPNPKDDSDNDDDDNHGPLLPPSPPSQQQNWRRRFQRKGKEQSSGEKEAKPSSDEERYGPPDHSRPRAPGGLGDSVYSTSDIELADLAPEVHEWRKREGDENTSLRLRKNVGHSSALDESNHMLSFAPMLPARMTHSSPASSGTSFKSDSTTPSVHTHGPQRWTSARGAVVSPTTPTANTALGTPTARRQLDDSTARWGSPVTHVIGDPDSPFSHTTDTTASTPTGTPQMDRRMQVLPDIPSKSMKNEHDRPFDGSSSVLFSMDEERFRQARMDGLRDDAEQAAQDDVRPPSALSSLVTSPPLPTLPVPIDSGLQRPRPSSDSLVSEYETATMGGVPSSVGSTATFTAATLRGREEAQARAARNVPRPTLSSYSSGLSSTTTSSYRLTSPETRSLTQSSASPSFSPALSGQAQGLPSLSQIYPQDLDYEHGVVLLSPPSSRSESPFSVISGAGGGGSAGRGTPEGYQGGSSMMSSSPTGSTTTNYLSMSEDGDEITGRSSRGSVSSRASSTSPGLRPTRTTWSREQGQQQQAWTGRSPLVPGDEEEDDFDIVSENSNASSSPFAMSPFASPNMNLQSRMVNASASHSRSASGNGEHRDILAFGSRSNRPASPAVSATSTTLSELELEDEEDEEYGNARRG